MIVSLRAFPRSLRALSTVDIEPHYPGLSHRRPVGMNVAQKLTQCHRRGKHDAGTSSQGPITSTRLPEFSLRDKVVLVSGGARGLGLTQAEALLEAGATGRYGALRRQSQCH